MTFGLIEGLEGLLSHVGPSKDTNLSKDDQSEFDHVLRDVIDQVTKRAEDTGSAKGSVIIKIDLAAKEGGVVTPTIEITTKTPPRRARSGHPLHATPDGRLSRYDDRQTDLLEEKRDLENGSVSPIRAV